VLRTDDLAVVSRRRASGLYGDDERLSAHATSTVMIFRPGTRADRPTG
jgi:hypothetical protein